MFCSAHAFKIPLATNTRIIYISRIYNFYRQIPGWWISLLKQGCIHSAEVYQSLPMSCLVYLRRKKKNKQKKAHQKKKANLIYILPSHIWPLKITTHIASHSGMFCYALQFMLVLNFICLQLATFLTSVLLPWIFSASQNLANRFSQF